MLYEIARFFQFLLRFHFSFSIKSVIMELQKMNWMISEDYANEELIKILIITG